MANLVSYSSSSSLCSSSSEEDGEPSRSSKGLHKQAKADSSSDDSLSSPPAKKPRGNDPQSSEALTLPPAILAMFNDSVEPEREIEEKVCHQGRTRSFPHVPGNWSTHVFLPVELPQQYLNILTKLQYKLQEHISSVGMELRQLTELHISLSRTVPIQYHWIEPLVDALRSKFKQRRPFSVRFHNLSFYVNDERTRSFIGLDIVQGQEQIQMLVNDVDECFAAYKLRKYYKDPIFHVSLYWCLGDIDQLLSSEHRVRLQVEGGQLLTEGRPPEHTWEHSVAEIRCKTGNKQFLFPLVEH